MHCSEIRERISYMLDNEPSASESALVTEHVAGCPECMRVFEAFHAVSVAMEGLEDVPVGFTEQVMDRVHAAAAPTKKKPRFLRFAAMAACFALVLLAGTSLVGSYRNTGSTTGDCAQYTDTPHSNNDIDTAEDITSSEEKLLRFDRPDMFDLFTNHEPADNGLTADGDGFSATTANDSAEQTSLVEDGDAETDTSPAALPDEPALADLLAAAEVADPALYIGEPDYIVTIPAEDGQLELYLWLVDGRVVCVVPDCSAAWFAVGTPEQVMELLEVAEPAVIEDDTAVTPTATPAP